MGFSLVRPEGLAALAAAAFAVAVWIRLHPPLSRGRARLSLGMRLAILVLITLALSGLSLQRSPEAQAIVILADRSASVTAATDQERDAVRRIIAARGGQDQVGLVSFGREPVVESPADTSVAFGDFNTVPNPNYTSIEAGLRLAASLLPPDRRRHLVVVTDGRQNIGDAITQARLLRGQGTRVDVIPLSVPAGPEAMVDSVRVPSAIPPGTRARARVSLTSNVANPTALRVFLDRALVYEARLNLNPGSTDIDVTLPAADPGFHTIRAEIDPAADTFTENNVGEALLEVLGPQRILVVEGHPGAAANIVAALSAASLGSTVVAPGEIPVTAAQLANYQAVVLVDVPSGSLTNDRDLALETAVRDLGLGLAAFGGPDTFGPGGMAGTPLEAALPIDMQISERSQKPPVAVMLVLESMESQQADAVMRSAAKAVVDHLTPRDFVGVTDGGSGVVVPLQSVANRKDIDQRIDAAQFGDSPSYRPYIQAAADALAAQPAATRHIIVVGDGDASDDPSDQVRALAAKGVTTSAIGINVHGQAQLMTAMRSISQAGKGRFYQSDDPTQVPRLLLDETQKGLKPWIVEERFKPSLDAPSPVLSGLDLGAFPALGGYIASTPKAAAEVVLRSPQSDPVLAHWQFGLGRALAWTSDVEGRWSKELLAWPQAGRFLANQVEWTLPLAADPALSIETSSSGDIGHVIANITGSSRDFTGTASVVGPDLKPLQVPLQATAPGKFEGDFPADQVGAYLVHVTVGHQGRVDHAGTAGLAIAYSPEYRFLGTDLQTLAALARAGGGKVMTDASEAFRLPVPAIEVRLPLAFMLLALAVLLLPLDIALRRLVFRRADAELWAALLRRKEAAPAAAEATLGRLRGRIEGHRAEGTAPVGNVDAQAPPPAGGGEAEPPPSAPAPSGGAAEEADLAARLLARRRRRG